LRFSRQRYLRIAARQLRRSRRTLIFHFSQFRDYRRHCRHFFERYLIFGHADEIAADYFIEIDTPADTP